MKVLIVETEERISRDIISLLNSDLYNCELVSGTDIAVEKIKIFDYACIIVNTDFLKGNGRNILSEIQSLFKSKGVFIISAGHAQTGNKHENSIESINLDDLAFRVSNIIQLNASEEKSILRLRDLCINLHNKSVQVNNQLLELTSKEFDLLVYFARNRENIVTKSAIAEMLSDGNQRSETEHDFIYTHIKNLRLKLVKAGAQSKIKSIYGTGYKFSFQL